MSVLCNILCWNCSDGGDDGGDGCDGVDAAGGDDGSNSDGGGGEYNGVMVAIMMMFWAGDFLEIIHTGCHFLKERFKNCLCVQIKINSNGSNT